MDKRIRRNEICIIGLPRCDFAFSSTRSCFIAYGFRESPLEMGIIRNLLEQRGIEAIEAGGNLAPGQNAFCTKICSKVITSQFCVVLLNNDQSDGRETPNANVNMEYGLMLGFNKYVIPFQQETQTLPFNVAGLDTIKYNNRAFEVKAAQALDQAIAETTQEGVPTDVLNQNEDMFLLNRNVLCSAVDSEGDRNLFRLGSPLEFNLLNDFEGNRYVFFGRFANLRPESVLFRIRKVDEILIARASSVAARVEQGLVPPEGAEGFVRLVDDFRLWVVVNSPEEKRVVQDDLNEHPIRHEIEVITRDEAIAEAQSL